MSAYLDIRVKNGLSFPNSSGLKVLEQYKSEAKRS